MKRLFAAPIARVFAVAAVAVSLPLTACDDGLEPAIWGDFPDTAELYSLARAEYIDRPGAYDFWQSAFGQGEIVVEAMLGNPFGFDMAVSEDESGAFLLLPTGYFQEASARPGLLADSSATFDELQKAPRTGYITEEPLVADTNVVYVVRTRVVQGCVRYGKMEILSLTPDGVLTLRALVNPNCGDRSLVPNAPVEDEDESGG